MPRSAPLRRSSTTIGACSPSGSVGPRDEPAASAPAPAGFSNPASSTGALSNLGLSADPAPDDRGRPHRAAARCVEYEVTLLVRRLSEGKADRSGVSRPLLLSLLDQETKFWEGNLIGRTFVRPFEVPYAASPKRSVRSRRTRTPWSAGTPTTLNGTGASAITTPIHGVVPTAEQRYGRT